MHWGGAGQACTTPFFVFGFGFRVVASEGALSYSARWVHQWQGTGHRPVIRWWRSTTSHFEARPGRTVGNSSRLPSLSLVRAGCQETDPCLPGAACQGNSGGCMRRFTVDRVLITNALHNSLSGKRFSRCFSFVPSRMYAASPGTWRLPLPGQAIWSRR